MSPGSFYMILCQIMCERNLLFAVIFALIGIIIFGAFNKTNMNYSYAFTIISTILILVETKLGVIQMRKT